jgi:hypothetical protein
MFLTFSWVPAGRGEQPLLVPASNVFFEDMRKAFGPFPLTLTPDALPTLYAMVHGSVDERAYTDLIDALHKQDTLTVTAQYSFRGLCSSRTENWEVAF